MSRPRAPTTKAHIDLGTALGGKGDLDGAIPAYREAIRLEPELAAAHYNLGGVLARNDLDGAILEFREAIRLNPEFALAHCNLGHALAQEGPRWTKCQSARGRGAAPRPA